MKMSSTTSLPSLTSSIGGSRVSVRDTVRHMLSANQIEFCNLRSRRKELVTQIKKLQEENTLLQSQQSRIHGALVQYESDDGDVPHMMRRHNDELRTLGKELRDQAREMRNVEHQIRQKEQELTEIQKELKKNQVLVENNKLPERDQLLDKFSEKSNELMIKEQKIEELKRQAKMLTDSHNSAIERERVECRDIAKQSKLLEDNIQHLQAKIKAADRDLANGLIYDQMLRFPRAASETASGEHSQTTKEKRMPGSGHKKEPTVSLQQKIQLYDKQRRELWLSQQQKREEKRREFDEKVRADKAREEKAKLLKEQMEREQLEKKMRQKEEEEQEREMRRLKLEAEKRRKKRREELMREKEQNSLLIAALERKVSLLEIEKEVRITETQQRDLMEHETTAEHDDVSKKLVSIREQTEVPDDETPIPVLTENEVFDAEQPEVEELNIPILETVYTEREERTAEVESSTVYPTPQPEEVEPDVEVSEELEIVELQPIQPASNQSFAYDRYARNSGQRRNYLFPPVVNKLHRGLPTYPS